MKTGACRRAFTTRSSRPLPRIGSVLAVQVTMMSNSCSRSGSSFSVIASAPKRSASCLPRSRVRLAIVIDLGLRAAKCVAVSSIISPAPMSSRRWSASAGKIRSASFTAAAAIEIDALPMSVLRAHVLGHREGALEQAVEHQAEAAGGLGVPHGLLHLAEDLRLAQHHRIEAARDAKRVGDRLFARQRVDVRRQRILRDAVEVLEPAHDRLRLRPVHIDLGPVAGRQDRGFLDPGPRQEVAQRVAERVGRERDLLPHVERCGLVVEAEGVERHRGSRLWLAILAYAGGRAGTRP